MEAYLVLSRGEKLGIILLLVCFLLFVPEKNWNPFSPNHPVTQVGQYEDLKFEKVDYEYDEDSWIINLELRSKGNTPVNIHEVYYTFYERQSPVKYETCADGHGVMLLKDDLSNPIMVPNDDKIIVEGEVCLIIGYIYSDAEVRTSNGSVDRYLVLSRNVNPGELKINNLTYIDHNGAINHWEYPESGPIKIPPNMRSVITFRVPDVASGDTFTIVLSSAGMDYTENIQLPITQ